jgi:hypothetical protein
VVFKAFDCVAIGAQNLIPARRIFEGTAQHFDSFSATLEAILRAVTVDVVNLQNPQVPAAQRVV